MFWRGQVLLQIEATVGTFLSIPHACGLSESFWRTSTIILSEQSRLAQAGTRVGQLLNMTGDQKAMTAGQRDDVGGQGGLHF